MTHHHIEKEKYEPTLDQVLYSNSLTLTTYDLIEAPIFIKDKLGRYLWANAFFISRSAGYSSLGEITNKTDTDFSWHEYATQLRNNDRSVIEARQSQSHYEQIIRHDGTYVNILTKKSPLVDSSSELIGLIGFSIALPQLHGIAALSARERECLYYLSKGFTDKKIAKQLIISPRTVETHLGNAKYKLGVSTRAELIATFSRVYPSFSG
ncbi:TPA: helix-turn-helix transcriptional regulator [Legionella pneumophila]|uniref:LuxR family transcriptional regulator n=2 Tax=Legionella TaxID=445 RepID=A0A378PLN2_9GAMM|nr:MULTISPECIES: PAS and helix-turn-helix domain-containing protein [Legionella]MCA0402204.1 helix-turn-helix transcriptional regulator [Pseudomonadota bacterium]KTD70692.1 LuxR family transcriptional regulator [Legionella steigerwaltii]MBN9228972.1 PAS domain-containing protein [Legionella steelei]MCL9684093.1 helix-turn-helix transcriptional regulator [Legionella maioricensis]MCL9687000.1 helix-turn-helix transcriptional regulator [Legionella maioricensis]